MQAQIALGFGAPTTSPRRWRLASPAAAYITGETLHVNGGTYMA
jgi:NAD(P)-dependent dehydrogenase (short-subunit alcohol dehydrogenase family)